MGVEKLVKRPILYVLNFAWVRTMNYFSSGSISLRKPVSITVRFITAAAVLLALLPASGCTAIKMGGTRSLPPTTLPDKVTLSSTIEHMAVEFEPFEISSASVSGGHYEGLLQVRQPWIWGLSDGQRAEMYDDLRNVARYALINEFIRLGLKVHVPEEHTTKLNVTDMKTGEKGTQVSLAIRGTISSIEMNTYGRGLTGTFEGYGSAGNYWEAEISFTDIVVADAKGSPIWKGNLTNYCKLATSPVKLDWTMFTLISKSLKMSTINGNPLSSAEAISASKADYQLQATQTNPVEIAARLAAQDLIRILHKELAGK